MRRNILDIRQRVYSLFVDGLVVFSIDAFLISHIFPMFHVNLENLAPFFVSDTFIFLLIMQSDTFCSRMRIDVLQNRFIYYYLTLPIHWAWIFIMFILTFMIELSIVSLPFMIVGTYFFSTVVSNVSPHWGLFLIHYITALFFIVTFFLSVTFRYSYGWVENNLWPRRMFPMIAFGAINATWHQIYHFFPLLAYVGLLNPLTYLAEGFRASLLVGQYIPLSISVSMLFICSFINLWALRRAVLKRFDTV